MMIHPLVQIKIKPQLRVLNNGNTVTNIRQKGGTASARGISNAYEASSLTFAQLKQLLRLFY